MRIKKTFEDMGVGAVYGLAYALSLAPMSFLYGIATLAFFLAYYIPGYRKAVVVQNVARCFPDKRYGEIICIVKKFYSCFTAYFAEILKGISAPAAVLDKRIVLENAELISAHVQAGKNVIACMGHCGNWEMLNFMPYKLGLRMYAVYKPLRSQAMNKLMIKVRARFGMKLIPDKQVARHILSKGPLPAVYLFLADQCPSGGDERIRLELFGQPTYVISGMERLARQSESAVVFLHVTLLAKGYYKVTCLPICAQAQSTREEEITRKYVACLEDNIVAEPYGWLWTHKRWKK
ncbi:lysophospholipid acyltransferase family protein [Dyadobacter sp. 676]|uniref:Lysophospholipid acyltransferase family protein n=1 Tax=Dyadobacter sp. 676 TaxID=3088362 RepID=A0AAU8FLU1_9BACT